MTLAGNFDLPQKSWSNLAKVVYKRTYARTDSGRIENWEDTVNRVILGNTKNHKVDAKEIERLRYFILNRKAMPAGRGLWFSGSPSHEKLGGAALNNCWFTTADDWEHFVLAQDLLMLGGGVGLSVEHKFTSKLPKVKKEVFIAHKATKDADFIVPDSREGWNESFTYSTICIRGYGELIKGFGGKASGAAPLIKFIENLYYILSSRSGKHIRPIDAADMLCAIGELVVSGNVRRSAIIIIGDAWDKEYLVAKRWDLRTLPSYRAMANYSVVCEDIEDLHPLYWKTYEAGEAFGLVNLKNIQTYARMGEKKYDNALGVYPCGESSLLTNEPCNLQEQFLPNLDGPEEFAESSRLMHRWGKRVTCEKFHNPKNDSIVKKNRRIGTGITGCLQSSLYKADVLDYVFEEIQKENVSYSKELNIPESIRTTLVKPSGTLSLLGDCTPGIHPSYSKFYIRRVRFASNDKIIPILKEANHNIEPVIKLDGTLDHGTLVSDFYCKTPDGTPCADKDFDTWKQLDSLLFAQKHWSDQAVSVTVYYKKDEIMKIKTWLIDNLKSLKTISFLCHSDHGFKQAPYEAITEQQYASLTNSVKSVDLDEVGNGEIESLECEGGICPVK